MMGGFTQNNKEVVGTQDSNPVIQQNIQEIVASALASQSNMYQENMRQIEIQIEQLQTTHTKEKPKVKLMAQPPEDPPQRLSSHIKVKKGESCQNKMEMHVSKRADYVAKGKKLAHSQRASTEPLLSVSKNQRRASLPRSIPKAILTTPKAKKKNHQILTSEFPPDFKGVKEALFIHIRLLWGLFEQNSVPKAPDPKVVMAFESRFSTVEQFEEHSNNLDTNVYITSADISTIREGRAGRMKLTKGIVHIEDSDIQYVHGYLANLGIESWGPNLDDSSESLWNTACRTGALKTFRQLAIAGVYNSMSFNQKYVNNSLLTIRAYNHYVHYLLTGRYKNETKEEGKHEKVELAKKNQKNRERLRERRIKFAVANDLPNRYKKIIENLLAHSDDEANEKDEFVVKTLPYRSNTCNIFFRRLDEQMRAIDIAKGVKTRSRKRVFPKTPQMSNFTKAPTGLPLDFYNRRWLGTLPINQQRLTVDASSVSFLPDPMRSLWPPQNRFHDSRERWSDRKFNKAFLEERIMSYQLDERDVDSEGGCSKSEEEVEGGVIDLEATSPEDSEEDGYFKDDDWAKLYCDEEDEDFEPVTEDEDEEEYEEYDEEREGGHEGYNDQEMVPIGGEE
ncbi:hypothetical protein O181_069540 [Austropuccinia psidii MF-1]|uniref:Uncharacterized protein n=1 Tax=Austropuccinia psidii MF-1 TaxID=1389203 RepID=A0A9Q3I868_9BASI|nr:hypothetical protein [Austropuccinia psidii MF-1]